MRVHNPTPWEVAGANEAGHFTFKARNRRCALRRLRRLMANGGAYYVVRHRTQLVSRYWVWDCRWPERAQVTCHRKRRFGDKARETRREEAV